MLAGLPLGLLLFVHGDGILDPLVPLLQTVVRLIWEVQFDFVPSSVWVRV